MSNTPETETVERPLPNAPINASEANHTAREIVRSGSTEWHRLCLKFVRTCWGLPKVNDTAREAWENAHDKHPYKSVETIPYGAPVFSRRPNAGADDAGHVFLAGGYNKRGVRIFRSVDIKIEGGVSPCTIEDIQERWGHEILGWTGDLNGFNLNLPAIPKARS
jgi:hypothetical protein